MADKDEKEKKPNVLQKWYRETLGELRKVTWPTRQEAMRLTWIVIAVMVAMGALLGILDTLFGLAIGAILS